MKGLCIWNPEMRSITDRIVEMNLEVFPFMNIPPEEMKVFNF